MHGADAGPLPIISKATGTAESGTIFSVPAPTISCNSLIIRLTSSGLPKKRLSAGLSASDSLIPRHQNDLDGWPPIVHGVSEL